MTFHKEVYAFINYYPKFPGRIDIVNLWKFLNSIAMLDIQETDGFFPENHVSEIPYLIWKPGFKLYGKICRQQRSVGFFVKKSLIENGMKGYKYSNRMIPCQILPSIMDDFLNVVNETLKTKFNSILVNRYENGKDYISFHRDNEKGVDPKDGVASFSLGEPNSERIMTIKNNEGKKVVDIPLKIGSLVHMLEGCQKNRTHGIKKQNHVKGVRISLTMRRMI